MFLFVEFSRWTLKGGTLIKIYLMQNYGITVCMMGFHYRWISCNLCKINAETKIFRSIYFEFHELVLLIIAGIVYINNSVSLFFFFK